MRKSDFYGVDVPELGDRADITVVSQAIIDGENNQSGRIEHLKATNSGTTLILSSETRADKLIKYYNGLSIQFVSPVNITAGNSYKIKIDNLAEQPYNNKTDIKAGDIVQAYYGASGFVSSNTPIPRSSSTSSSSEVTVATSLAVKNANDNANSRALKATQIIAGKGLTGGGDMSTNRTIDVVSKNDGIIVNDNDIQLNTYSGLDSDSTSRPLSANQGKILDNKKANRYYVPPVDSASVVYLKIGNIPASAGFQRSGVSFILSGGNNIGQSRVQKIVVTTSSRGYSGAGVIPDSLLSAVDITGDDYVSSCSFILKLNGSNLELWFKGQAYPYDVSIDAIQTTGDSFGFNTDMTWTATSPVSSSDTYKEYPIRKMYHTGNFDPATKFDKIGGTVNGDVAVTGGLTVNGVTAIKSQQLEIYGKTPYIDFHYNNESNDFTSRFIDNGSGLEYVDSSGKNFNLRNVLTSSILPSLYQKGGYLTDFDGTYGDFIKKTPNGVYPAFGSTLTKLGIPSSVYGYGSLIVNCTSNFGLVMIYIPDNQMNFWFWSSYNVVNNPTKRFDDTAGTGVVWRNLAQTKTDIGLGNVENVPQVTDVRFTGLANIDTWNQRIDTYSAGRVICGVRKDSTGPNIDGVYYATMQKKVAGTWYTLAVE